MSKRLLIAAGLLALAGPACSATFCVGTAAELEAKLIEALTGDASDTIRVRTGTYVSPANGFGAGGSYPSGASITIEGGWFGPEGTPCLSQGDDPAATVIDGNDVNGGMQLSHQAGGGAITVRNLTFRNGYRQASGFSNDRGGGLYITGSAGATNDVLVERCIFQDNYASFLGGGLHAGSDGGTVTVRNNLLTGNSAAQGAALYVFGNNDLSYVSNNTATGNIATTPVTVAAFAIGGDNAVTLTNNIFWGNTSGAQSDLYGPELLLIANDIEKIANGAGPGSSGNVSIDPRFAGAADFRLAGDSPLIDSGVNTPLGGLPALDLDGQARLQAKAVDLGAYEFALLFRDGFE